MRRHLARVLLIAALLVLPTGLVGLRPPPSAVAASAAECNGDGISDWLCRRYGEVEVGKKDIRRQRPVRLAARVRVVVGSAALAEVSFAQQASCKFGEVIPVTVIIPRVEGGLFDQRSGSSACESLLGQRMAFNYFCNRDGPCPVRAEVDGKIFSEWHPLGRRARRQLFHRPAERELVLSICATSYRVTVRGGGSSGESLEPIGTTVRIVWRGASAIGVSSESDGEVCSLEV